MLDFAGIQVLCELGPLHRWLSATKDRERTIHNALRADLDVIAHFSSQDIVLFAFGATNRLQFARLLEMRFQIFPFQ